MYSTVKERTKGGYKMTDRIRFENNAKNHGATILISTPDTLKILATNGILETTYKFDEAGKFVDYWH